MSKDFFDEEYDKVTEQREKEAQQNQQAHGSVEDWYNYGGTTVAQKSSKKPLYVVLLCVGLVLTLVLGWVLCALFGGGGSLSGDEQRKYAQALVQNLRAQGIDISDEQMQQALQYGNDLVENGQIRQEALLSAVLDYLHNKYVTDLDGNEQLWQDAIAAAGTALLQSAGDRFCSLMTPQQYYDYVNQVSETTASPYDTYFGVAYSYQSGLGLYVSTVSVDGSCYGIMQEGDVILAVTEPLDNLGNPVTADGAAVTEMVVADYSAEEVSALMAEAYSAKFRVLRNGDVFTTQRIVRGGIGLERPSYNYRFVEFYFNDSNKNISTTNQNNAVVNTYQLRQLSQLPQDTGYVRITEFMYYMDGQTTVTAATEFVQVMKLFRSLGLKRLVLDLKGNPGGLVSAVCDIAAMLVQPRQPHAAAKAAGFVGQQVAHNGAYSPQRQRSDGNARLLLLRLFRQSNLPVRHSGVDGRRQRQRQRTAYRRASRLRHGGADGGKNLRQGHCPDGGGTALHGRGRADQRTKNAISVGYLLHLRRLLFSVGHQHTRHGLHSRRLLRRVGKLRRAVAGDQELLGRVTCKTSFEKRASAKGVCPFCRP